MTKDWVPLPSPSSAPEEATDTAEGIKPRLMMRSAVSPSEMVSGLSVNIAISGPAKTKQIAVPAAMMTAHSPRVTL